MALDRKVRACLLEATQTGDAELLQEAHELLCQSKQPVAPEDGLTHQGLSPELPVLLAEAAIQLRQPELAEEALRGYFLRRDLNSGQFMCRAYLARAQLEGFKASQRKGQGMVDLTLAGLAYVQQALDITKGDPRYKFLVYNASVHYWWVSRALRRTGYWHHLLGTMPAVVQAMSVLPEEDNEWRVRALCDLARVYDEAKQPDQAAKTLTEANTLAAKLQNERLNYSIYRMQLNSTRNNAAQFAALQKLATTKTKQAQMAVQTARTGIAAPAEGAKGAKPPATGAAPTGVELNATEKVLSEAINVYVPAPGADGKAAPKVEDKKGAAPPEPMDLRLVGELGLLCMCNGNHLPQLAERCAAAVEAVKDTNLSAIVMSEYIRALLLVDELGPEADLYTRHSVEVRCESLARLDKALISAGRADDPDLVQEGAILIWNTGLPLLQPNLRLCVRKAYSTAAGILAELDSPLHELRAQLHLEIAKCEVAGDLFAAAIAQCDAALRLDYKGTEEAQARTGRVRPLDAQLQPLYKKLVLKMSLYQAPERGEDKALLLVEQGRDAKGVLRANLLERAATILSKLPPIADRPEEDVESGGGSLPPGVIPEPSEPIDPTLTAGGVRRERATLWCEICKLAWAARLPRLTLAAAKVSLSESWDGETDRDLVLAQAQIWFAQAEAQYLQLSTRGLQPGEPLPTAPPGAASGVVAAVKREAEAVAQQRLQVLEGFVQGMRLGVQLKEDWIVINAGVYLWNYFLPLVKTGQYADIFPALDETFTALRDLPTRSPELTSSIGAALADALLARHAAGQPPPNPGLGGKETSADRAVAVAEAAVNGVDPMVAQRALGTLARAKKAQGGPAAANPVPPTFSPEAQIFMCLELMKGADAATTKALVGKAADLVKTCPANPELAAKLAKEALTAGELNVCVSLSKLAVASTAVIPKVIPKLWRWFALAECCHGQALLGLVDPATQDKGDQDQLRRDAMARLVQAAKLAAAVPLPAIVTVAAQQLWNAAVAFMKGAATRRVLLEPLLAVVKPLQCVPLGDGCDEADVELRVKVFKLLLECLADRGKWHKGLSITEMALRDVPNTHHKSLWEARIVFLGNMGQDTAPEMLRVKESGPHMAAKAWATLARNSTSASEQLRALQAAVDCLASHPLAQVEYRIELAEWLLLADYPAEDCQDQLLAAVDALTVLDNVLDAEDDAAPIEKDSSSHKGSQMGSSVVRSSAAGGSLIGSSQRRGSFTAGSQQAGSIARSSEAERSDVELGVEHLEALGRIFFMLAKTTMDRAKRDEYLLCGQNYFYRILSMSTAKANATVMEEAREAALAAARAAAAPAPGKKGEKGEKAPTPVPDPALVVDKGEVKWKLPTEWAAWVGYHLPEDLLQAWAADKSAQTINSKTISRPEQFLHYVEWGAKLLSDSGFDLAALPLWHLLHAVATKVMQCQPLAKRVRLENAKLYASMGAHTAAAAERTAVGSLQLTEAERRVHGESYHQRLLIRDATKGIEGDNGEERGGQGGRRASKIKAASNGTRVRKLLLPLPTHAHWLKQGRLKLEEGDFPVAGELLLESLAHARAFEDHDGKAWGLVLLAQLSGLRGDTLEAIRLQKEARACGVLELPFWVESTVTFSRQLMQSGDQAAALSVLDHGVEVLRTKASNCAHPDAVVAAAAEIQVEAARVCAEIAVMNHETGRPTAKALESMTAHLEAAQSVFARLGGGVCLVEVLRTSALCSLRVPPPQSSSGQQLVLMGAVDSLKRAEEEADQVYMRAQPRSVASSTLFPPPARTLCETRLLLARTLLSLAAAKRLDPWAHEERPEIPDFPKTDKKFVKESGDLESSVRTFLDPTNDMDTEGTIPEEEAALLAATAALGLATSDPVLKADSEGMVGSCLRQLAESSGMLSLAWRATPHIDPDQFAQGLIDAEAALKEAEAEAAAAAAAAAGAGGKGAKGEKAAAKGKEVASSQPAHVTATIDKFNAERDALALANCEEAKKRIEEVAESQSLPPYVAQSREHLEAAITVGRATGRWDVVQDASLNMALLSGTIDPLQTAEHLAVYQSCKLRQEALRVLALAQPPNSREAQMRRKIDFLASRGFTVENNEHMAKAVELLAANSVAQRRLEVGTNIFTSALKTLSPTDLVVSLALHQDRADCRLLMSAAHGCQGTEMGRVDVACVRLDAERLRTALALADALQSTIRSHFLSLLGAKDHLESGRNTPASKSGNSRRASKASFGRVGSVASMSQRGRLGSKMMESLSENAGVIRNAADHDLDHVVMSTEALLTPVAMLLTRLLAPTPGKDPLPPRSVTLVLDQVLAKLPVESLGFWRATPNSVKSITREFSLQMFLHRQAGVTAAGPKPLKKASVSYMVDPRCEVGGAEVEHSLVARFNQEVLKQYTGWKGILGTGKVPSEGDYERLLTKASGALYLGLGQCLGYVDAGLVSSLNLPQLMAAIVVDGARTEQSHRRQSKIDNNKHPHLLALEESHTTALLLSLRGANMVVLNRWATDNDANMSMLKAVLEAMAPGAQGAASVLWQRRIEGVTVNEEVEALPLTTVMSNTVVYGMSDLRLEDDIKK